jgi:hypothetical protein
VNIWIPLLRNFPPLFSYFFYFKARVYTNYVLCIHIHHAHMLYTWNINHTYNTPIFNVHNFIVGTNLYHTQLLGFVHHYLVHTTFGFHASLYSVHNFCVVHQYPTKSQLLSTLCKHTMCTLLHPILNVNLQPCPTQHQYSTHMHCTPLILLHVMFIINVCSFCITNIQCAHPAHYCYVCTHQFCMASIFIVHVMHSHIMCVPLVLYPTVPNI